VPRPLVWWVGGLSAVLLAACEPVILPPPQTELQSVDLATYGLFDVGVTDADADGRLDLYTVNHSARQSVTLNRGGDGFRDVYASWHLDQDPRFPGLYVAPNPPPKKASGVYVYWQGPWIHVDTQGLGDEAFPIEGSIDVLSRVEGRATGDAQIRIETALRPRAVLHSVTRFELSGPKDGIAVAPRRHAQPIEISIGVDPQRIHVGAEGVSPRSARFSIFLRDRHGMAWDDIDGDGRPEIFITRGGLRAAMARYPMRFWDELFDPGPEGMRETGRVVGLEKFGCPGRQAAWVDYDGDADADLYVACGRGPHARDPNRLYRREPDGRFHEVGSLEGVGFPTAGHFAWVDLWGDSRPELIWADRDGLRVCTRGAQRFDCTRFGEASTHVPAAVRVTDVDEDGDFDVLVVSRQGNRLFLGEPASHDMRPVSIRAWGLPRRSFAAVWADRDNDGHEELYALPGGVFTRNGRGFHRVARLGLEGGGSPWRLGDARIAWADLDGNGGRDAVLALNVQPKKHFWARKLAAWSGYTGAASGALAGVWLTRIAWAPTPAGHWLALDVEGPAGDRASLGARVRLFTRDGSQLRYVGHAEGAHYSSGHYRVYFGLGARDHAERLQISWPDGETCTLEGLAADRLYRVGRPSGSDAGRCTRRPVIPGTGPGR